MALKAVQVSDVPNLDHKPQNDALVLPFSNGDDGVKAPYKLEKFIVIGHRGSGMNMLYSTDARMKAIKENSILSFNEAARSGVEFVEFDVQVTRDGCPVIFHDIFILTEKDGCILEKKVTDLTLEEFLHYGPQKEPGNGGLSLLRKAKDGRINSWKVAQDDPHCTLQEVFEKVADQTLGFNIELKFDDNVNYQDGELVDILQIILQVVFEHAKDRPIIFSSFQPDSARLVRKLQTIYPVFYLTNGGSEVYSDVRRNSLDEAVKLCLAHGLQGIVSEVRATLRNLGAVPRIKEANLTLLTYGQLNNVPEVVYLQHLMGVEGVIVDLVKEIVGAVSDFVKPAKEGEEETLNGPQNGLQMQETAQPMFSKRKLSFLLKLIPVLTQVLKLFHGRVMTGS